MREGIACIATGPLLWSRISKMRDTAHRTTRHCGRGSACSKSAAAHRPTSCAQISSTTHRQKGPSCRSLGLNSKDARSVTVRSKDWRGRYGRHAKVRLLQVGVKHVVALQQGRLPVVRVLSTTSRRVRTDAPDGRVVHRRRGHGCRHERN